MSKLLVTIIVCVIVIGLLVTIFMNNLGPGLINAGNSTQSKIEEGFN